MLRLFVVIFIASALFLSCGKLDISCVKECNGEGLIASSDICDFYFVDITSDTIVESNTFGCSRYIDCENAHVVHISIPQPHDYRLGIVFYDNDKDVIERIPFSELECNANMMATVAVPESASFFRTSYYNSQVQIDLASPFRYRVEPDVLGYRKYQDGNIFFNINVNQSFSYYSQNDSNKIIKSTTGVLALPKNYTPDGEPVPIIMYCHGYSHYVFYDAWGSTESFRKQKRHWTDMGYAVFDINGPRNNNKKAGFYSAGSPQFVEAMRLAYEYIRKHYNVTEYIYVVGGSAGGPLALNYARFNTNVKGVALLSPWTDLYNCTWQLGHRSIFVEFYNFPNTEVYLNDVVAYYDPSLNKEELNIPIKLWIGGKERGSYIYTTSISFINGMREMGKNIDVEIVEGLQHSQLVSGANEYVDKSVVDWFKSL